MFRLVVLSALLAVAAAAPGHLVHSAPLAYSTVVAAAPTLVAQKEISYQKSIIEQPTVEHVGTVLKTIPTGVPGQRQREQWYPVLPEDKLEQRKEQEQEEEKEERW
uniref:Uncharacterized protein n=1 Tax=Anopheles stephensi TaxID=30069 RepID=A0A182Y2R0_ANOST